MKKDSTEGQENTADLVMKQIAEAATEAQLQEAGSKAKELPVNAQVTVRQAYKNKLEEIRSVCGASQEQILDVNSVTGVSK